MDFHQLLAKMQQLDQPAAESAPAEACGDPVGMPAPMNAPAQPPVAPPSMSVNLNAQGMDNIEDLLKLITKVNPEMEKPSMPPLPSMGMEPSIASIKPTLPPLKMLPDLDKEEPKEIDIKLGGDDKEEPKKDKEEEYANEPDVDVKSADYMNNKLAGGMNRPKDTFPKVADGDNPMQKVKEGTELRAQIRAELLRRLEEAKGAK